jgi:SAM-dependent methyltransferase
MSAAASFLRRRLQPILARVPALRSLVLTAIDLAAQPLLLPFRRGRPRTDATAAAALVADTDRLNRLAETYYATRTDADHLGKPYSEPQALSRRLIDVGVLLDGLRLQPGHTVLELGAGSCWLSHMLNQFGCPTISVDVSPTAVALGRRLFVADPHTNWALNPEFLVYDGHRLPLESASVDRAIVYDAFHHVPNRAEILRELRRVLRPDGIVGLSEPGRGHAGSASSIAEVAATGVLEEDLVLEDIAQLALDAGFGAARVIVDTGAPPLEINAQDLRRFMGGRGLSRYWRNLCAELDGHHYLLLFAGAGEPTTRQPHRLKAVIRALAPVPREVRRSEGHRLALDVYNAGDTCWLCSEQSPGWTRVGIHLHRGDQQRTLVDYDWVRTPIPHDVPPERNARIEVEIPPIEHAGDYVLVVDLVIEGVLWFADRGSMPLQLDWRVG